jgi:hypothetical protein
MQPSDAQAALVASVLVYVVAAVFTALGFIPGRGGLVRRSREPGIFWFGIGFIFLCGTALLCLAVYAGDQALPSN